jgi:hypothetical protein
MALALLWASWAFIHASAAVCEVAMPRAAPLLPVAATQCGKTSARNGRLPLSPVAVNSFHTHSSSCCGVSLPAATLRKCPPRC